MIRVLHMIGSLSLGGSQAFVMNLYRNVDRRKFQFDFVVHRHEKNYYADEVLGLGGKIYELPAFIGSNLLEVICAWNKLFKEHSEYRILHSHVRSYAVIYLLIAKLYGVKTIIHSHSTSNGQGIVSLIKNAMQFFLRYTADYFMSCSKEAGRWLFGTRICSSERYYLIPNAIDLERYVSNGIYDDTLRKAMSLLGKRIYIHVGNFREAKNHRFLLEAFNRIHDREQNAVLILVGDGELRSEIEEKIKLLGLRHSVLLLGSRDDVPELLRMADVFLFPSKWEGLPVAVIEAQAAGLPCVVSNTISKDVAISPQIHMLGIDDAEEWAQKAIKLGQKKDVVSYIRRAGYDVKVNARRVMELYAKFCGEVS